MMRVRYGGFWWLMWRCWSVESIDCPGCTYCPMGATHYRVSLGPLELWLDVSR